jgi:hypothetical protein
MKRIVVLVVLYFTLSTSVYSFSLSVVNHVRINTSAAVALDVSPASPGDYTYEWSADTGSISGSGVNVTYNAPGTKCKATISVTVNSGGSPVWTGSISTLVFKKIMAIECDDFGYVDWTSPPYVRPAFKEYMDYMESQQMKFMVGMMVGTIQGSVEPGFVTGVQGYINRGYMEVFFHGILHDYSEFALASVAEQIQTFTTGIDTVKTVLGYTMPGFDAPGDSYSAATVTAINNFPEMTYWLDAGNYPGYTGFDDGVQEIACETDQHPIPADFISDYNASTSEPYGLVTMHPPWWDNPTDLDNWGTIVEFLKSEGATVLFTSEYARMLVDPAYVADEEPGGGTPDTTPPGNISTVNDGTGTDIDSTSLTVQLSANWTAATDWESSISKYWYAIGDTPGSTGVAGWTDNGNVTNVTRSSLALTIGTTYYFTVKAENGVSLQSNPASSDGQWVGATPPDEPIVKTYPNPLTISKDSKMTFRVTDPGGEVKIYTVNGKLVKELVIGSGENEVDWNLLNEEDNSITAGLYLYTVTDGAGNKKTGKLAITQ